MIRVVMMTLVRWDDRGEEMNQEEADQDVADKTLQILRRNDLPQCSCVTENIEWRQSHLYLTRTRSPTKWPDKK